MPSIQLPDPDLDPDPNQSGKVWIRVLDLDPVIRQLFMRQNHEIQTRTGLVRNADPVLGAGSVV